MKKLAEKEMHLRKLESQLESMKFNASMLQTNRQENTEKELTHICVILKNVSPN